MRLWLVAGAINGFLAVALGAFAAHGLSKRLEPRMLEIFEIGVRYQMYHGLALLAVAWLVSRGQTGLGAACGYCFLGGIVVFSGSLYALALTGVKMLGAVTPFGGVALLAGWGLLALAGSRIK
jgi:uncharacterized membrane protein YgdD (TMEM256/DUF423 family)